MDVRVYNLINNTKSILYINSNDTVNDIKNIICSSLYPYYKITASGTNLFYIDKITKNRNYMFSPYRWHFSNERIIYRRSRISIRFNFCHFIRKFFADVYYI